MDGPRRGESRALASDLGRGRRGHPPHRTTETAADALLSEGANVRSFAAVRGATRAALPRDRAQCRKMPRLGESGVDSRNLILCTQYRRGPKKESSGGGAVEVLLLSRDLMAMVEPTDRRDADRQS